MVKLFDQLCEIFNEVQNNPGCHQRCSQVLSRIYDRSDLEEFAEVFSRFLKVLFRTEVNVKNLYVERSMQFAVVFIARQVQKYAEEKRTEKRDEEDETSDNCPLLPRIINEVLSFHNLEDVRKRYHSCKFITMILDEIGDSTTLNNDLCDDIQNAMLQRITDPKSCIRIMAVQALLRLQTPEYDDCPVIAAFLIQLNDPIYMVRRTVVEKIAPSHITIPQIVVRVRDVNDKVRAAAFAKVSLIPPNYLKIVERQKVCFAGFDEPCRSTKRVFLEMMLPKWLTHFEENFLRFLGAIRLDADESDIENTARLSKLIMEEFFRTQPIESIISFLPIDEDKLVPSNKLSTDIILYWSLLQQHLLSKEDPEEILERILPDLLPFCDYIERFMNEREQQNLKDWKLLEYHFILLNLFNMTGRFDLSDEMGKQRLHQLVITTLSGVKLEVNHVDAMVEILEKTVFGNLVQLTEDISDILSTRETVIEEPSQEKLQNWNFKLAQLKVKLNIVSEEVEEAIEARDLKLAALKEDELKELRREVTAVEAERPAPVEVSPPLNEGQRGHQNLDILSAVFRLPAVTKLTPTLRTLKDELTRAMSPPDDMEAYRKLHRCMALACVIDRRSAEEDVKMICTPVASYRILPEYDKETLIVSVNTLIDMMRLYGLSIFEGEEDAAVEHQKHRKLYNPTDSGNADIIDRKSIEYLIESIILMLDDECQELRDCASVAIGHMLYHGIMVSPTLLSRIQLKLYNPLTEKENPRMCQVFACAMLHFAHKVSGSADIVEKSIIPTLTTIGNAPKTSPLADINIDEITKFFSLLTLNNNSIVDSHKSLAYSICSQISKNIDSKCVPVWLKMLLTLNPPIGDKIALKELKTQVLLIIEDVKEKSSKERLRKYISILDSELNSEEGTPSEQITEETNNVERAEITFNNKPDSQVTATNGKPSEKIQIISDIQVHPRNAEISECRQPSSMQSSTSSEECAARIVQVIADVHHPPFHSTSRAAQEILEKQRERKEITSSNINKEKISQEPSSSSSEDNESKTVQKAKKQKLASSEDGPSISAMKECAVIISRIQGVQKSNSQISDENSIVDETDDSPDSDVESLATRKSVRLRVKKTSLGKKENINSKINKNTDGKKELNKKMPRPSRTGSTGSPRDLSQTVRSSQSSSRISNRELTAEAKKNSNAAQKLRTKSTRQGKKLNKKNSQNSLNSNEESDTATSTSNLRASRGDVQTKTNTSPIKGRHRRSKRIKITSTEIRRSKGNVSEQSSDSGSQSASSRNIIQTRSSERESSVTSRDSNTLKNRKKINSDISRSKSSVTSRDSKQKSNTDTSPSKSDVTSRESKQKSVNSDTSTSKSSVTSGDSNVAVVGVDNRRSKLCATAIERPSTRSGKVKLNRDKGFPRQYGNKTSDDTSDSSLFSVKTRGKSGKSGHSGNKSSDTGSKKTEKRLRARQKKGRGKRIKLDSSSMSGRSTRSSNVLDLSVISETS